MKTASIFYMAALALTMAFWNSPAQAQPVEDWYWVQVDSTGKVVNGGGSGWGDPVSGEQWFYYPDTNWWNEWFYNAPFDPERKKKIEVEMGIYPLQPGLPSYVEIAYNWSTDKWENLGISDPPIPAFIPPGEPEEKFIQRHPITLGMVPVPPNGLLIKEEIYVLDYNPEWVSIDVRGENFQILDDVAVPSTIRHECLPVKWKQLPNITHNGIDIKVDEQRWLGDDFKCTSKGPLTGIHFWVSYLDDYVEDYAIDSIHLEIYSDDPVGPGGSDPDNPYSKPDERLWFRDITRAAFAQRLYATVDLPGEYWWDPATAGSLIQGADQNIYQIDIDISDDDAFFQEGTPDEPKIYWLVVQIVKNANFTGQIGWKTRQWPDHFMDDAVYNDGAAAPNWEELRYPPGHPYSGLERDSIDLAFVIQGEEVPLPKPPFQPVKWSQPPVPVPDSPPEERMFLGWDEESVLSPPNVVPPRPFCADDFYCLGPKPVTKIHWWGSFRDWAQPEIPDATLLPQAFQIGFWTDVPVDPDNPDVPFSHPGEMVWEVYCIDYKLEFFGWDVNPESGLTEAKFQFNQDFLPEERFHQLRENEIYWVSIAADYGDWSVDPQFLWGWETRPHMFQDDAVRIFPLQANIPPHPGYKLDPHIDIVEEIIDPQGVSWDLAYELGTDPNYIKWAQRFDPRWDWNTDILSQARYDPDTAERKIVSFEAIVADDWPCRDERPIMSIEWWGSYLGYDGSPGVAPPRQPDFFLLSIWTDKPANPLEPDSYSHPDQLVWTYRADNYVQVPVGKETMNNEVVFQYFVNLPSDRFFFQEPDPDSADNQRIYWLSVVAVYSIQEDPPYNWGWTNHKHVFMDDAAFDNDPISPVDPWQFDWQELQNPTNGETWDMSFVLETYPDCYPIDDPAYPRWIFQGKPKAWCCEYQDQGDATGDGKVNFADLIALKMAFGTVYPNPGYNCRVDFDRNGAINFAELITLKMNFGSDFNYTCPTEWHSECGNTP